MALVRGLAACETGMDAQVLSCTAFYDVARAYDRGSGADSPDYQARLNDDPGGAADALAAASRREE